ncbi:MULTISPECIES: GNAT family N-acetyltransferase [unclassified Leucobacter]|uniref:GNAT family N-acetyltransferase n=1 Tax=unclassified Leucobacter TaxID=2621730 RepID=UPI00165E8DFA|nr:MULTISPECIES: GNAT family N-acetyltransferase [unclassified Leucobacter]MBC9928361.1 GNAT family N-acetyltransferase [Leucobacter sp. cx-169]MBC9936112.1 GNAT family N-acetyltransferase [Leucobacter sp. cx-87]
MIISSPVGAAIVAHLDPAGAGGASGRPGLIGRELLRFEDVQAANELYGRVFAYQDPSFALNPNLLFALKDNGGSVVGVFTADERLVGFAYGFAGKDASGSEYHYSQATVVDPEFQGKGLGRQLKMLQRRVAERWGHRSMRWTFDPVLVRNGHFNFSTLGAIGTDYLADYYGRPGTDRLLAEWALGTGADHASDLRETAAPLLDRGSWGQAVPQGEAVWVPLPAAAGAAEHLRTRLADTLRAQFAAGRVIIDCRRLEPETTAYLFVPRTALAADHPSPAVPRQEQS